MRSFLFSLTLLVALVLCLSTAEARITRVARAHNNQVASKAKAASSNKAKGNNGAASASSNSTADATSSNSTVVGAGGVAGASSTSSAAAAARTRPCDQGDQSLAAGLQANTVVGIGLQASVATIQGLLATNGAASDIQDGITRLQQFLNTSTIQIQMALAIADDDSLAQPQLATLQSDLADQTTQVATLTGAASDNATLATLLTGFQTSTGTSQDGADNAVIDCFLPLTAVSG